MARLREFDDKTAMHAVEKIFWEKGYDGTSYADLTNATGLGKGSLYAAFGNKKSLYLKALENYIMREVHALGDMMKQRHADDPTRWRERLADFFNVAIDAIYRRQDRRGCFLCNAAVDLAPFDKAVEVTVMKAFDEIKAVLSIILQEVVSDSERERTVEHMLSVYIGMRVMAKAGASPAHLIMTRDAALASF